MTSSSSYLSPWSSDDPVTMPVTGDESVCGPDECPLQSFTSERRVLFPFYSNHFLRKGPHVATTSLRTPRECTRPRTSVYLYTCALSLGPSHRPSVYGLGLQVSDCTCASTSLGRSKCMYVRVYTNPVSLCLGVTHTHVHVYGVTWQKKNGTLWDRRRERHDHEHPPLPVTGSPVVCVTVSNERRACPLIPDYRRVPRRTGRYTGLVVLSWHR